MICVTGGRRFNYLFYVDFVGNLADDLPQNALRHLQEVTDFMRVLGCYTMHAEAPSQDVDETEPPAVLH